MRTRPPGRAAGMARTTLLLVVALALTGCLPGRDEPGTPHTEVRIAAGSEIRDLEPLLRDAGAAVGVDVRLDYLGTVEGTERLADGELARSHDATWFASNRYLSLEPAAAAHVRRTDKIMTSPVALGLRRSVADRLGWVAHRPTWREISDAAAAGRFTYGMTDPASSNSGFSGLVSVATALSDTGSALTEADVAALRPKLTGFFSAQRATAGSSGWLADEFAAGQAKVDGLVNYESVLATLDTSVIGEPLAVVIPTDGVVTADYPLSALDSADPGHQEALGRLADWLRTPDVQRRIAGDTGRRPVVPGLVPPPAAGPEVVVEQPFPATLGTAQALMSSFVDQVRKPAQTVYTLDVSGSMQGPRIEHLHSALDSLTGISGSAAARLTAFRRRESLSFLPFSDQVGRRQDFQIPADGDRSAVDAQIRDAVAALQPGGQTAIYSALDRAYEAAEQDRSARPDAFTSVVLMTDGQNNAGIGQKELLDRVRRPSAAGIPTFVVLFGEADEAELREVAEATGGKVFDARTQDLTRVFREIRGYQ